ncbi:sigma-70 family RNA polymerase sigma factor [Actinoplanes sp. NPDC051411]|uniref:RNA polymerase sigma factor n=1 Tax=Actinoplanes sp. NPDC051411 TaxID=3155522 RepID=UPI0034454998
MPANRKPPPESGHGAERIGALIETYRPMLLRFLGRNGQSPEGAEDIFQETMFRVWRNLDNMPGDRDGTRRWLFAVARRLMIDGERRRQARPLEVCLLEPSRIAGGEQPGDWVIARESLRTAFSGLGERHREVLIEVYCDGKPMAVVARELGIPLGTVKSRAHHGMRALRRAVLADDGRRPSARAGR